MERVPENTLTSQQSKIIAEIAQNLTKRQLKLVTAESCTGGWVSQSLTALPGSSEWFECGLVTYSNRAKQQYLGVKPHTLAGFGAVSEQVVMEMAEGALKNSFADVAVAVTGIAGPAGGTIQKPVGTCWFACIGKEMPIHTAHQIFIGDRQEIRWQAVVYALTELNQFLSS